MHPQWHGDGVRVLMNNNKRTTFLNPGLPGGGGGALQRHGDGARRLCHRGHDGGRRWRPRHHLLRDLQVRRQGACSVLFLTLSSAAKTNFVSKVRVLLLSRRAARVVCAASRCVTTCMMASILC